MKINLSVTFDNISEVRATFSLFYSFPPVGFFEDFKDSDSHELL